MDDDFQRCAARNLEPALGELAALLERKRVAFPGAAADKGGGEAVAEQMFELAFDGSEVERAIRLKRRVGGGNKAGEFSLFMR